MTNTHSEMETDTTAIERVAWAIHLAFWLNQYGRQVGSARHAAEASWPTNKRLRCVEARAAIAAMPSPWLDIKDAPRDGTNILAAWDAPTPEYKAIGVVFWFDDKDSWAGGWLSSPGHWGKDPTHWQPLPSPPLSEDKSEDICCNGLSPEDCARVPSRHCDGLSEDKSDG